MKHSKKTTITTKGVGAKSAKAKRDESEAHSYCIFTPVVISSLCHDQMQLIEND